MEGADGLDDGFPEGELVGLEVGDPTTAIDTVFALETLAE